MGLSAATVCGLNKRDIPLLSQLLVKSKNNVEYDERLHHEIESFIVGIKERKNA